jgi:hypothetical protein
MCDYSQGKIYRICLPGMEEFCYVGSTYQNLNERLWDHKYSATSDKVHYKFASCIFFTEDNEPIIELLEEFPCETKQELLAREKIWCDKYPDRVNKNPPILTEEERLIRSREISLKYFNKNKEKQRAAHRAYLAKNKEEQNEKNRLRMAEKRKTGFFSEKIKCEICQKEISRNCLSRHKRRIHSDNSV